MFKIIFTILPSNIRLKGNFYLILNNLYNIAIQMHWLGVTSLLENGSFKTEPIFVESKVFVRKEF